VLGGIDAACLVGVTLVARLDRLGRVLLMAARTRLMLGDRPCLRAGAVFLVAASTHRALAGPLVRRMTRGALRVLASRRRHLFVARAAALLLGERRTVHLVALLAVLVVLTEDRGSVASLATVHRLLEFVLRVARLAELVLGRSGARQLDLVAVAVGTLGAQRRGRGVRLMARPALAMTRRR
jgi:hypothetical protein